MNRRSLSSEPAPVQKLRNRASSLMNQVRMSTLLKHTPTSNPIFEKRQSSGELMLQKFKQKFKPMNRQVSSPSCGFRAHQPSTYAQSKIDDRSRWSNTVYAPCPHSPRRDSEDVRPCGHMLQRRQWCSQDYASHRYSVPYGYDEDGFLADEDQVMDIQKLIYRAKSEAKTVSVVNGCLYINYQYIGPLPPGVDV